MWSRVFAESISHHTPNASLKMLVMLSHVIFSTGRRFSWTPPYVSDTHAEHRLKEGYHFPVKSCWNGLVTMNATPFIQGALKFRSALYFSQQMLSGDMTSVHGLKFKRLTQFFFLLRHQTLLKQSSKK